MSMKDFEIIKQLGKGAFAAVLQVRRKKDNQIYALKKVIIDKLNKKEQNNSLNEVRLLASIKHINIIGYKEAFFEEETKTLNIVMEFADDGDLNSKIKAYKKSNTTFNENCIWSYAIQMVQGLKALHDNKIMHRDLKSANIFLMKDGTCKLGDLNVSKVVKMGMLRTQTGTPFYASPEVWKDRPYSYKSDLWSIGCVIYELCTLNPPFKGRNMDDLYKNVCRGRYERINKEYSNDLSQMIAMLLRVNSDERPTCEEFLNSPLITRHMWCVRENNEEVGNCDNMQQALLNTIKFRDIKEIKTKLPKVRYYEDNSSDNIISNMNMMRNEEMQIQSNNINKEINGIYKNNSYKNVNNIKGKEEGIYNKKRNANLKDNKDKGHNVYNQKKNIHNKRPPSAAPVIRNYSNKTPLQSLKQVGQNKKDESKTINYNNNIRSEKHQSKPQVRPKSAKIIHKPQQVKSPISPIAMNYANVHPQVNQKKNLKPERPSTAKQLQRKKGIPMKNRPYSSIANRKKDFYQEKKNQVAITKQVKPKIKNDPERKMLMKPIKIKEPSSQKKRLIKSNLNQNNYFLHGNKSNEIKSSNSNEQIKLRKVNNK